MARAAFRGVELFQGRQRSDWPRDLQYLMFPVCNPVIGVRNTPDLARAWTYLVFPLLSQRIAHIYHAGIKIGLWWQSRLIEPCVPVYLLKCSGCLFIGSKEFKKGSFEFERIKRFLAPRPEIVRDELVPSRFAHQFLEVIEKVKSLLALV